MSNASFLRRLGRGVALAALLGSLVVVTSACEEAFSGPSIDSMTVEPDTIPKTDVGMFDEFFTITIQVSGFEAPIADATAFIADNNKEAPETHPDYRETVQGNTITMENIPKQWFKGQPPGIYDIGAEVVDEDGTSDQQRNLATVTVTDN